MQKTSRQSFADTICNPRTRKIKATFFKQMNSLLDWDSIDEIIKTHYHKGKSATGKPSYSGLLLFKACLLGT